QHVIGAAVLGLLDQPGGGVEIVGGPACGSHRDQAEPEGRCPAGWGAHAEASWSTASSASSRPAASSAYRSSQPPTCVAPTKICGTVVRPLARSIISMRRSGLPVMSISVKETPFRLSNSFADRQ